VTRPRDARLVYSTEHGVISETTEKKAPAPASASGGRPSGPGIRLLLERRASGRVVTVVTGLPGSAREVAELCKALKSACGAGGTVKDGVLELQGDHRPRVEAYLQSRGLRFKRSGG
jgi:translation initiation factor 1